MDDLTALRRHGDRNAELLAERVAPGAAGDGNRTGGDRFAVDHDAADGVALAHESLHAALADDEDAALRHRAERQAEEPTGDPCRREGRDRAGHTREPPGAT